MPMFTLIFLAKQSSFVFEKSEISTSWVWFPLEIYTDMQHTRNSCNT